jgi:hypothetical protein
MMMRKSGFAPRVVFCALFFVLGSLVCAQNRSSMAVYVPLPTGGTADQRSYFQENFKMELIGANYPSVESKQDSMYTLLLEISDNLDFDTSLPADDSNNRFMLGIKLERSADNTEIVRFSFLFTELESMANWNLFLLYQALANAYSSDEEGGQYLPSKPDDRWRHQWLYLNLAAGADLGLFLRDDERIQTGVLMPMALAGVELHFLDFLSTQVDVKPHLLALGEKTSVSLGIAATAKIVLKFSTLMLEPYGGVEYAVPLGSPVPPLSVLGGFQLGTRGAPQSAWTIDFGITRNLMGNFEAENGQNYNLMRLHVLGGFKFGFKDRKPLDSYANAE